MDWTPMTMTSRLRLLMAGLALFVGAASAATAPRVRIADGTLEGRLESPGVQAFKGIPFAAPPVGALRWKAPQPVSPWKGVRQAAKFGPRAMQLPLFGDMVFRSDGVSEDCLYLNVWTPAKAPRGGKLPVLVYFYGGGFAAGDGSEPRYDGASMARHGIVAVTVNYRLNVFGFLAHPELTAESPHHASGNYGLMDQSAALAWVRKNIAAFGGDPERVTIAGESAGSWSVSAQMASPLSKGLIAGAIGESGALLGMRPPPALAQAEKTGSDFAALAGAASLAELRAMPAEKLLQATSKPGAPWPGAIVDGYVLPRPPAAIYAAGEQARVPLLAGWNSAEGWAGSLFGKLPVTEENFTAVLQKLYGDQAEAARKAYAGDVGQAATDLASDQFIAYGTWKWIDTHARNSGKPTYRYYYTRPRPATKAGGPAAEGAGHSVEIEYALGNLDYNQVYAWTAQDREVSRQMQSYFVNFIKTGNPNGKGLAQWPALSATQGAGNGSPLMVLDTEPHVTPAGDGARHAFQDGLIGK
jgi:para-nitrobenzyl esterase